MPIATALTLAGSALLALALLALAFVPLWLVALGPPEDPAEEPAGAPTTPPHAAGSAIRRGGSSPAPVRLALG